MTEREALKLALEALQNSLKSPIWRVQCDQAITACKQALAQPEQEPVARYFEDYQGQPIEEIDEARFNQTPEECRFKLYTTPPQPEQSQVEETLRYEIDALEAKLAECRAQQPEPVIDKSAAIRIATALGWEPKRTWVGLTDEDCKRMSAGDKVVAMWADRTLKEKNT